MSNVEAVPLLAEGQRVWLDMSRARGSLPKDSWGQLSPHGVRLARLLERIVDATGQRPFVTEVRQDDVEVATNYYGEDMHCIRLPRTAIKAIACHVGPTERVPADDEDLFSGGSNVAVEIPISAKEPAERSSRAEVRNPLLTLPAAGQLLALDAQLRAPLRALLMELRAQAHLRAELLWKVRKGPMAVYFRSVAVYAGHAARLLRDQTSKRET